MTETEMEVLLSKT